MRQLRREQRVLERLLRDRHDAQPLRSERLQHRGVRRGSLPGAVALRAGHGRTELLLVLRALLQSFSRRIRREKD